MSSGGRVPETRLLGEGELSADHAWRALRRYGSWRLLRDAFLRFRSGDGFSHARALGLQLCLAAVPLLIALNGLASKGVLMASEKVDAQTAFTRLRRQARNTRRSVPEVAREIIDGVWGSPTYRQPAKPGRGNKVAQKH